MFRASKVLGPAPVRQRIRFGERLFRTFLEGDLARFGDRADAEARTCPESTPAGHRKEGRPLFGPRPSTGGVGPGKGERGNCPYAHPQWNEPGNVVRSGDAAILWQGLSGAKARHSLHPRAKWQNANPSDTIRDPRGRGLLWGLQHLPLVLSPRDLSPLARILVGEGGCAEFCLRETTDNDLLG